MLARSRQATALLRALQAAAPPSSCGGQGLQAGSELLPALQHLLELTRQCSHVPGGAPAAAAAELPPPATLAALATRSTSTSTPSSSTRASSWSHGLHTSAEGRDSSSSSSSIGNGGELGDGVAEVDDSPAVGSNGVAEIRLVAQRDSSVKQTVELLQREVSVGGCTGAAAGAVACESRDAAGAGHGGYGHAGFAPCVSPSVLRIRAAALRPALPNPCAPIPTCCAG